MKKTTVGKVTAIAAAGVSLMGTVDAQAQTTRDRWLWPFASNSIWNMPIGSNAQFVDANITDSYAIASDDELLFRTSASDPLRNLYDPASWTQRCATGTYNRGVKINVPDSLIVADARQRPDGGWDTPNNCAAFLRPDGIKVLSVNPLARCTWGGDIYGYPGAEISIYGNGLGDGGHGGSGLSTLGGSIRQGELFGSVPIRHALKINLWAERYYYYRTNEGDGKAGFRWPAVVADNYAASAYKGTNPNLQIGSLLAIPGSVSESSLGLETGPGRKLFQALQNFGAYTVDDSAWNAHYFCVQDSAVSEFRNNMGYSFYGDYNNQTGFYRDAQKLFKALKIVSNNSSDNIGGGGSPRTSYAPPFATLVSNPGFENEQYNNQSPSGWSEWSGNNYGAGYTESYGGNRTGNYHGTHWASTAYNIYTHQTKTGLANGTYTLRAWAKRGGGQQACYMEAKDFGGSARTISLPVSNNYQLIEIKGINVTNGQCTFGFWSNANAGNWAYFDDVEFFRE